MTLPISRSDFLRRLGGLSAIMLLDRSALALPAPDPLPHPEPRDGVTAERVLKADDLGDKPRKAVLDAYEAARHDPQIFDGLACGCGCHGQATHQHRSLLVCYETRQPTGCPSCRDEATLAGKLIKEGKTLAEIRAAVDKRFG